MKLKELLDKYGEWEWVSTQIPENGKADVAMIQIKKPKQKSVWDLEKGDNHHWIDITGDVCINVPWQDTEEDKRSREMGIVFLTEEEAEKDVERRKVETLLIKHDGRRWFNGYNHNFHIGLDEYEEHLKAYILMTPTQGTIYFDTSARAEKAIYEIGEERIKKALFEVR